MKLVITEKPEVAGEVVKTLSQSYEKKTGYYICTDIDLVVTWAAGNMMKLADPEYFNKDLAKWNLEQLPMKWPVKFIPEPRLLKQLNIIGKLLDKCSMAIAATDTDAAGAEIFFQIIEYFNKMHLPMLRLEINDNNLIQKAWDNAKDAKLAYNLALTERARAIADQRTGYNLTRSLTCQAQAQGWQTLLTAGRVQSFFVSVIVRRELERKNFTSSDYYNITANVQIGEDILKGIKYVPNEEDPVDEANRIINKNFAEQIATSVIGKELTLNAINKEQKETTRPLPYDLATLQGACDRLFNYSLDAVLKITQKLRERKLITYNRTDSQYLSDEAFYDAPNVLGVLSKVEMFKPIIDVCTVDESNISRCFNSSFVSAHHAIIPTINPSNIRELGEEEFNVYYLIVRNYVTQFMAPEIKEKIKLEFSTEINGELARFKIQKSRQIQAGWQILFAKDTIDDSEKENSEDDKEEENFNFDITLLEEGGRYNAVDSKLSIAATTPPPFYTITSLLNAVRNSVNFVTDEKIRQMLLQKDKGKKDRGGIGTAATRTPIITELFKKKLLKKINSKIRMTDASLVLYKALPASVTSPETTAIWANQQAQIEDGELSVDVFIEDVEKFIASAVHEIKQGIEIPEKYIQAQRFENCPHCGEHTAERRTGKHGVYWLCQPCSQIFPDYEDLPFNKETMKRHTETCPKCNGEVEKFNGKFGTYWKCETCGNLSDLNGKPFFELCPECNKPLRIVQPKASRGKKISKQFVSCTGYPNCKYTKKI